MLSCFSAAIPASNSCTSTLRRDRFVVFEGPWRPTVATEDKLGVVAVNFCTKFENKTHVSSLMSHEFSKLAAQKKVPGVSEGAK